MTITMNNGSTQRKQLSSQLDRLDEILDGLAEALNESVASAVKDVVGEVVRESVEATIREVLGNPDLLQAALAKHKLPEAKRSVKDVCKNALSALLDKSREAAKTAKCALGSAWGKWAGPLLQRVSVATKMVKTAGKFAWQCRRSCFAALCVGVLCGIGVYHAGPVIASVICGVGSSLATVAGIALAPVWRFMIGSGD